MFAQIPNLVQYRIVAAEPGRAFVEWIVYAVSCDVMRLKESFISINLAVSEGVNLANVIWHQNGTYAAFVCVGVCISFVWFDIQFVGVQPLFKRYPIFRISYCAARFIVSVSVFLGFAKMDGHCIIFCVGKQCEIQLSESRIAEINEISVLLACDRFRTFFSFNQRVSRKNVVEVFCGEKRFCCRSRTDGIVLIPHTDIPIITSVWVKFFSFVRYSGVLVCLNYLAVPHIGHTFFKQCRTCGNLYAICFLCCVWVTAGNLPREMWGGRVDSCYLDIFALVSFFNCEIC